jgi:hypothetical protein
MSILVIEDDASMVDYVDAHIGAELRMSHVGLKVGNDFSRIGLSL